MFSIHLRNRGVGDNINRMNIGTMRGRVSCNIVVIGVIVFSKLGKMCKYLQVRFQKKQELLDRGEDVE